MNKTCNMCVDFMGTVCGNPMTTDVSLLNASAHTPLRVTKDTPVCGYYRPNPAIVKECKHCGKSIVHYSGCLWHDDHSVFPQYCSVDMAHGSKLHEPKDF